MGKWSKVARERHAARMQGIWKEKLKHRGVGVVDTVTGALDSGSAKITLLKSTNINGSSLASKIDDCISKLYELKREVNGLAERLGVQ